MGTGKTKVTLDTTGFLFKKSLIELVLVVAPKGVIANWIPEIETHLPPDIKREVVLWNPSLSQKRRDELNELHKKSSKLKFLLMNVEAFSTKKGVDVAELFVKRFKTFMVVDESTTIKNRKAKRTKALCAVGRGAVYRRILTGSPVTRSPLDLFSQMAFLDPSILGFNSFYAFQGRYSIVQRRTMGAHSFNHVVGFRRLDVDLPDKVYTKRIVALTPEQQRAYQQMKKLALARLDSGELSTTKNVLTQIMRLQQICCGNLTDDDGNVHALPSNRIKELMDLCEEIQGKAIIWATWTMDIRSIADALRDRYGVQAVSKLHGETPDSERQQIVEDFQNRRSELRFLVGHPRTGGYGLTLTAASTVIYYSNSYDLELRVQSEDRAHRIGQTNKVTYVDLIVPGTIDEKIVKSLRAKINVADEILGEAARAELFSYF